jgi:hypothetical protein
MGNVYMDRYMGLYGPPSTWATHTYSNTPRSLNFRHNGVQDWTPTQRSARLDKKESIAGQHPPAVTTLATADVEAGPELGEGRGGETIAEDISKLGGGRDVENPNGADGDEVADEVLVDLHVFGPLVLDRVGGEIHRADVVAVDEGPLGERGVKLSQELP